MTKKTKKNISNKSVVFYIIFMAILLSAVGARSFNNEPDGYGGFAWGTSFDDYLVSEKKQLTKKDGLYFGAQIGGVDVDIGYEFIDDILYRVLINFPPDDRDKIVKHFVYVHGKPVMEKDGNIYWIGSVSKISLKDKEVEIISIKYRDGHSSEEKSSERKEKKRGE